MGLFYLIKRYKECEEKFVDKKKQKSSYSFVGMIFDYLRYGSSIYDYFRYHFYEKSDDVKSTYVTCKKHKLIQKICNKDADVDIYRNKARFNQLFKDYIKREWIDLDIATEAEISDFLNRHKEFFLKEKMGMEGRGVKKLDNRQVTDVHKFRQKHQGYILEEAIVACNEIAEFCPASVNTLRVTVLKNQHTKKFEIMSAVIRTSIGAETDNFTLGGIVADIDIETGRIISKGINSKGEEFEFHPVSGKRFENFVIPCWNDIVDTIFELCEIYPLAGYVGFDVVVSNDRGVLIIEGNDNAHHGNYQLAKRRGMWPDFKERIL
ncbi:MAG: hypothetical protein IJ858_02820 [Acidaminococcaceae bacterium]|nr:hypothetical protein [Acidaminococcaceae bacterium]